MPTPMDALLGLVVLALGTLGWSIAFLITDSKKRLIAYSLAGLMSALGLFYYVSSEMRSFEMRRRVATLQRQQQINLNEIQQRLQQVQDNKK